MSSRFKSLGFGSKRKSAANIQTNTVNPSNASTSTTASTPPPPSSSQTSLPMNPQQLGRPPSYQYNTAAGRPQSPMPPGQQQMAHHPAPINTNQGYMGQHGQQQMGPPQPPGYGGAYNQMQQQQQQQQGGMQYMNTQHVAGRPAEVAGDSNRSKAQLIVGIDFVSKPTATSAHC
jgi:hypothetical protein